MDTISRYPLPLLAGLIHNFKFNYNTAIKIYSFEGYITCSIHTAQIDQQKGTHTHTHTHTQTQERTHAPKQT